MDEDRREMMLLLRRRQAAGRELSEPEAELLGELESEYIGRLIVPVLRDRVRPLVEAFGAPLEVMFEIDAAGEAHYWSHTPCSPSEPAWPEKMTAPGMPAIPATPVDEPLPADDGSPADDNGLPADYVAEDPADNADDVPSAEAEAPVAEAASPAADKPKLRQRPRFRFSMIGLKPGDMVTFRPTGLQVRVATDNLVEHEGRQYYLSTFVREFLPAEQRNTSGAYQGALYFTYRGRTLDSLRPDKRKN